MTTITKTMFLQIGERRYQVYSYEQASAMFCKARDVFGEGASKTPSPALVDQNGVAFGYVSYNGRVWAGEAKDWSNETATLLYCPQAGADPYARCRAEAA